MKKLFISQPINGKTTREILEIHKKIIESAEMLLGEPVEVIDSIIQDAPAGAKPLWYLGKSIEFLSKADIAYFCSGMEKRTWL